jgi:polar amino acid transport system substrate-binding protein
MTSRLALLLALLLIPMGAAADGEPELKVAYLERPPYYWTENDQPRGFLLDLTRHILEQARIPSSFEPLPPNRILEEMRQDHAPWCSIGWFRTPEREAFAKFSLPIYRDKRLVLLTTRDKAELFGGHRTLREVFLDRSLIMAQMASFSYGAFVDALQQDTLARSMTVSTTTNVLPRLIAQNRAHYMLLAPEEVATLLASAEMDPGLFVTVELDDIPPGNLRFLMFSRRVPDDTITRIDAAIAALTNQEAILGPDRP